MAGNSVDKAHGADDVSSSSRGVPAVTIGLVYTRLLGLTGVLVLLIAWPWGQGLAFDDSDRHRISAAIKAMAKGAWDQAARDITEMDESNPALMPRYLLWRELADKDSAHTGAIYLSFLDRFSHWPRSGTLRARMEERIGLEVASTDLIALFERYPPVTAGGRIAYALALQAHGQHDEAANLARKIWREDNLGASDERRLLAGLGDAIESADHVARLDDQLWKRNAEAARRLFRHVDSGHRKLAEARIRLQRMMKGVDRAIGEVPRSLRSDPGLTFDRLRWRRRKGRDAEVREILANPPEELGRPSRWWYERAYQIRELLDARSHLDAYRLARLHGQESGIAFAEAEWLAGWVALRFAGRAEEALERFTRMYERVGAPISKARAAYWAGRAASALDRKDDAAGWYREAAVHQTTFYGQEAAHELDEPRKLGTAMPVADTETVSAEIEELFQVARMLCSIDKAELAIPFWQKARELGDLAARVLHEAEQCGRPDLVIVLGKQGVRVGSVDPLHTFPVVTLPGLLEPAGGGPDPGLMLAVARQESHFDAGAASSAGALGLMQIMPRTARAFARKLNIRYERRRLLREPNINAAIGAAYLRRLLETFNGADYLVAAAYNAGPPRVWEWIRRFGDPREMSRHDRIDWLEHIPFGETRNYVQRVLEGRSVYGRLISEGGGWRMPPHTPLGPMIPTPLPRAKPRTT